MRKLIFGIAAAATLAFVTTNPTAASAAGFSAFVGIGHAPAVRDHAPFAARDFRRDSGRYGTHHVRSERRERPRRDGGSRRHESPREAERCIDRVHRRWDGRTWVTESRRTCR